MNPIIRKGTTDDSEAVYSLYKKVASIECGLARNKDEITSEYISSFVKKSIHSGVIFVAEDEATTNLIGEIHCYSSSLQVFAHVLGELTIAVDPVYQGKGIGRLLFEKLLNTIINEKPEIQRVELIARESNRKAIAFYESLGFAIEGRFEQRIQSVNGEFEADILL